MILLCALVGLFVGSLINWAGDYLPRFASGNAALSSESISCPGLAQSPIERPILSSFEGPALWHLLTSRKSWIRLQTSASSVGPRPFWSRAAVEVFSALLFAYLWWRFGLSWRLLLLISYCSFLLLIAVIDLRYQLVLNVLIYPAAVVAMLLRFVPPGEDALTTLLGGAVGLTFFSLVALLRRGGMGAGDVKLAALIGLMVGFPQVVWALALGILTGGIVAVFLLLTHLKELNSYMPYAPFLCLGAAISLVYTPTFPFPPF
jgi:prepilin signal peptidase PulO-like enzyme (type II secretory pathway)